MIRWDVSKHKPDKRPLWAPGGPPGPSVLRLQCPPLATRLRAQSKGAPGPPPPSSPPKPPGPLLRPRSTPLQAFGRPAGQARAPWGPGRRRWGKAPGRSAGTPDAPRGCHPVLPSPSAKSETASDRGEGRAQAPQPVPAGPAGRSREPNKRHVSPPSGCRPPGPWRSWGGAAGQPRSVPEPPATPLGASRLPANQTPPWNEASGTYGHAGVGHSLARPVPAEGGARRGGGAPSRRSGAAPRAPLCGWGHGGWTGEGTPAREPPQRRGSYGPQRPGPRVCTRRCLVDCVLWAVPTSPRLFCHDPWGCLSPRGDLLGPLLRCPCLTPSPRPSGQRRPDLPCAAAWRSSGLGLREPGEVSAEVTSPPVTGAETSATR